MREYRRDQNIEHYNEMNLEWRDIIIKKRSSGPTMGQPLARSIQLFDMCSYDPNRFRECVPSEGFQKLFDLDEPTNEFIDDDERLLLFSFLETSIV